MKSRRLLTLLVFAFVFALGVSPLAAAPNPNEVLLEYKCQMGDAFRYDINMDGFTTMRAGGKEATQKMEVQMRFEQKVLHVKDDRIDLQMVIESARAKAQDGEAVDLAEQIGKTVYITMKRNGEILGMTSFDKNFDPNQMSVPFPETPVKIGESWTQRTEASAQIPLPIEAKYTLESFQKFQGRNVAVIEQEIKVPESEKKNGIEGSVSGTLFFDYEKGVIVRNHLRTSLVMQQKLRNDDPKLGPAEKKVTTLVKMNTRMELSR